MKTNNTAYDRALKRVEDIKKFYSHLRVYIIINVLLLLIKAKILSLIDGGSLQDLHFERWLDWNSYGTAILWGIGLLIHGLYAFHYKFNFIKKWEERKIEELMNNNDESDYNGS